MTSSSSRADHDGQEYQVDVEYTPKQIELPNQDFRGACGEERAITIARGAGYLGTATLGTCLVSLVWFRRRDVP